MSLKVYQSKNPRYAGHTAGPWEVLENSWDTITIFERSSDTNVCILGTEMDEDPEMVANAALIADAPYLACEVERLRELCGELVGAISNILELKDNDYYGASCGKWSGSWSGLRAALSKAKGGDE